MDINTTLAFPLPFPIKKENIDNFATHSKLPEPYQHTDVLELKSHDNQSAIKTEHDWQDFVIDSTPCSTINTSTSPSGSSTKEPGSILLNYLFSKSLSEQQETKGKDVNLMSEIETVHKSAFGDYKLKTEEIQIKDEENGVSMAPNDPTNQEKNLKDKSKAIHKCTQCSYTTENKSQLKGHLLCHPKPDKVVMYKCDQCTFESNYKKNLKRHITLKHKTFQEVNTFKCNECDYQTPYKTYIKEHVLKHTNPEETYSYQCAFCDYKSICRRNLNRHLIKHHKDPKDVTFKCDLCSFRTYDTRTLNNHYIRHSKLEGIELHGCHLCHFSSVSEYGLKRHVDRRHIDELKPFRCEKCGARAADESALAKHFLRKHKNKKTKMRLVVKDGNAMIVSEDV